MGEVVRYVRVPWKDQPPDNWPLLSKYQDKLRMMVSGSNPRDAVTGDTPATFPNNTARTEHSSIFGSVRSFDFGGTAPNEYEGALPNNITPANELTVVVVFKADSLTQGTDENRLILLKPQANSGTHNDAHWTVDVRDGNSVDDFRLLFALDSTQSHWVWDTDGTHTVELFAGEWYCAVCTWKATIAARVTVNGKHTGMVPVGTQNGSMPTAATDPEVWIGGRSDGTDDFDGMIPFVGVWERRFTNREAELISANPWAMFQPQVVPVYTEGGPPEPVFLPYYPKWPNVLLRR